MSDDVNNGAGRPRDPNATRQHRPADEPEARQPAGAPPESGGAPPTRPHGPARENPQPEAVAALTRKHEQATAPETRQHHVLPDADPGGATGGDHDRRNLPNYVSRNLPPDLAEDFTTIRDIASGGQASILLCQRKTTPHDQVAIKLYHHRTPSDADDPRERLRFLPEEIAVRYVAPAYGSWNGQWWEVHEYLEHGSVKDLAAQNGGRLDSVHLTALIGWGANALEQLHHRTPRIIHRDLKPANILVRSLDPLQYALADFGLAILTDSTHTKRSVSRTQAYAPPEAISGAVGPPRDWWGFGMAIAELAVGRHPYQREDGAFLPDTTILDALTTKPVPLDHIEDECLLLLLRGLLTRDPDERWNHAQVRAWLQGETPALGPEWASAAATPPVEAATLPPRRQLEFLGETFDDPALLGRYIAEHWQRVANALAGRSGSRELDQLVGWIDEVAPDQSIRGSVDSYRSGRSDPVSGSLQLLMAKIVVHLDPVGEPTFMGERIDLRSLSGWAARIGQGSAGGLQKVSEELFRTGALHVYAQLDGYEQLAAVQRHWEAMADQSHRYFHAVPAAGKVTPEAWAVMLRLAVVRVVDEDKAASRGEEEAVTG